MTLIKEFLSGPDYSIPALLELARWDAKHVPRSVAPKNIARPIKEDRDGLIEELKSSLK